MKYAVHFVTPTGHLVAVEADDGSLAQVLQRCGERRWLPTHWPVGGYRLPLEAHETMNWAVIGAKPGEVLDRETGEKVPGVWWGGEFYKRRDLEANPKKRMGACVKYSRGAREGADDPARVEGDDSGFRYVTLITFRGEGQAPAIWKARPDARPDAGPQAPAAAGGRPGGPGGAEPVSEGQRRNLAQRFPPNTPDEVRYAVYGALLGSSGPVKGEHLPAARFDEVRPALSGFLAWCRMEKLTLDDPPGAAAAVQQWRKWLEAREAFEGLGRE